MGLVQLFFIILLSPLTTITNKNAIHAQAQCLVLLELRKQLVFNSSNSRKLVQWNRSEDCCRWEGVRCDSGDRVSGLVLGDEGISGGLDESSSLFSLEYLEELDLSNNVLNESHIPIEFDKLTHLTSLILTNCSLRGYFPRIIFHLPTLQYLDLSHNPSLRGAIPQLPQRNSFTTILLSYTNFSGSLPNSVSNLEKLSYLDLSHCKFTGPIPLTLANLTRLVSVVMSNNFFNGSISSIHFETLSNLVFMDLSHNSLTGVIPISLFTLPLLQELDLHGNQLSGLQETLTIKGAERKFTSIDFSNNNFHGDIPEAIGEFHRLYLLNLSHNSLTGTIPKSFGKLRQLELLDLSVNRLRGKIPEEIAGLTFLQTMNVSHNKLVGKIPIGSQIQTFSSHSFEGNEGLCGLPLNISCTGVGVLPSPPPPPPQGNVQSEIEWGYVSGALGFVVGLGITAWVLLFCPSFREKYFEKVDDFFYKIINRRRLKKRRDRRRRALRHRVRGQ